ncbi:MAG: TauD/TfdA family dioxygenase [Ilumatobacteraceae bacterium]
MASSTRGTTTRPEVAVVDGMVRFSAGTGLPIDVPIIALRDSCACSACRHPSGQRLLDPACIPMDARPTDIDLDGDSLRVTWMPERHESRYSVSALLTSATPRAAAFLWDASAAGDLPVARYEAITASDANGRGERLRWLRGVERMGCGLLHGVPTADGEVARAAEVFGHVRETNYGRWFDVRSVVEPSNLANTSLGLAAHTDNPYRDPVPTMQLLHCLESTASGGENMLVDGWRVAEEVRSQQPAGFDLLVRRSVTFAYRDSDAELSHHAPLIELDSDGMVRGVRFNPRSMQQPSMPAAELRAWYDAYLLFARLLADPRFQIRLRLEPGDLFIVDNRRVLHGRTAFAATSGSRHFQGCYADIDGLRSSIAVLSRKADH